MSLIQVPSVFYGPEKTRKVLVSKEIGQNRSFSGCSTDSSTKSNRLSDDYLFKVIKEYFYYVFLQQNSSSFHYFMQIAYIIYDIFI